MLTLALESSCDETAAAILRGPEVLASVIASQIKTHRATGGVVPEVASRNHLRQLRPVLQAALEQADIQASQLDLIAATSGPGLASSLLIGHTAAKGLALGLNRPFMAINHLEGHLLSPFLGQTTIPSHTALIVSGGHSLIIQVHKVGHYQLLARSVDDAAGEAFDKVGKMLELPYPGGPEIERVAQNGDPKRFPFPQAKLKDGSLDFSFSGLKTAVLYTLPKLQDQPRESWLPDLCASFQESICQVLVRRLIQAAQAQNSRHLGLSGGVACNNRLRTLLQQQADQHQLQLSACIKQWSTDNAAMIAYSAHARHSAQLPADPLERDINPNLPLAQDAHGAAAANRSKGQAKVTKNQG